MEALDEQTQQASEVDEVSPDDRGIMLRCIWCKREQRIILTKSGYTKMMTEHFLLMMTGGQSGKNIPGLPMAPAVGTASPIGKSVCCDAQTEGELFGAWPEDQEAKINPSGSDRP